MEEYNLIFDVTVNEMEEKYKWREVTELVYQQWKENPTDISKFLCAGTELWYALLEMNYYEDAPEVPQGFEFLKWDVALKRLRELTRYGEKEFGDKVIFNLYFGFMINVYPYFFIFATGSEEWFEKGKKMLNRAYELEPDNFLVKAIYYEQNEMQNEEVYVEACKEIWSVITPEQWGNSSVKRYLGNRLMFDLFYPDVYGKE